MVSFANVAIVSLSRIECAESSGGRALLLLVDVLLLLCELVPLTFDGDGVRVDVRIPVGVTAVDCDPPVGDGNNEEAVEAVVEAAIVPIPVGADSVEDPDDEVC